MWDRTGWQRVFLRCESWERGNARRGKEQESTNRSQGQGEAVRRNRWEGSTYEGRGGRTITTMTADSPLIVKMIYSFAESDIWLLRIWGAVELGCISVKTLFYFGTLCHLCNLVMLLFWFLAPFFCNRMAIGVSVIFLNNYLGYSCQYASLPILIWNNSYKLFIHQLWISTPCLQWHSFCCICILNPGWSKVPSQ